MLTIQGGDVLLAESVNGVLIRITEERLSHIYQGHPEVKGYEKWIVETIENPDLILEGDYGALLAVKKYEKTPVSAEHPSLFLKPLELRRLRIENLAKTLLTTSCLFL